MKNTMGKCVNKLGVKYYFLLFIYFVSLFTHSNAHSIELKPVVSGFKLITDIQFFPISSPETHRYALVAQKSGQLAFADFQTGSHYSIHEFSVMDHSELGLLGIAFHPDFNNNQQIYINYNPSEGERRTRVSEFLLTKTHDKYQLTNERIVLEVAQPYRNHNGGQLAFGPDGYLYIGMGDGGSRDDPENHSQNLSTLLGAMLRIDVNTKTANKAYGIPIDNPFIKNANAADEIWAYGLRNPWRFSFAPDGQLIAADVGQNSFEEVSIVSAGANLGWNIMEANACFKPKENCDTTGLTLPKVAYGRKEGRSITGGYVYTGNKVASLKNHYLYADYIRGNIWAVDYPNFSEVKKIIADEKYKITTFGQDHTGEVYLGDLVSGDIYQLVP